MTKKCIVCGKENLRPKSIYCSTSCYNKNYNKSKAKKMSRDRYNNSDRGINTNRKWRESENCRNIKLKAAYGITVEEYNKMLIEQNSKCLICEQPESRIVYGKKSHLSVDHNHKTGKVRGLLCSKCNLLLGNCKENINILKKAVDYLSQ